MPSIDRIRRSFVAGGLCGLVAWSLPPSIAAQTPPRNQCSDVPGHVSCWRQHNGLIHGGTVTTPEFTVACRAFRLVWMKRYHGRSGKRDEWREVVVAGVCEQRDRNGELLERWRTASDLPIHGDKVGPHHYQSLAAGLPASAIRQVYNRSKKGRWDRHWRGYYIPAGWGWGDTSDTGRADFNHWGDLGGSYVWDRWLPASEAVESPTFAEQPACGPGYVICTAYLKVLHPEPEAAAVVVEMIGAYRWQRQRHTTIHESRRIARWHQKVFR